MIISSGFRTTVYDAITRSPFVFSKAVIQDPVVFTKTGGWPMTRGRQFAPPPLL